MARLPAELGASLVVDIDALDTGKHSPAASVVFARIVRYVAADDLWRMVAQLGYVAAAERGGGADDIFRKAGRLRAIRRGEMRADHVLDIDASVEELIGLAVGVGIGLARCAVVVLLGKKARGAQHDG